jgi:hypothetical protein
VMTMHRIFWRSLQQELYFWQNNTKFYELEAVGKTLIYSGG